MSCAAVSFLLGCSICTRLRTIRAAVSPSDGSECNSKRTERYRTVCWPVFHQTAKATSPSREHAVPFRFLVVVPDRIDPRSCSPWRNALPGSRSGSGRLPLRLVSHIFLSIAALPLVLTTFFFLLTAHFPMQKRIARLTFPIWLYVSITA